MAIRCLMLILFLSITVLFGQNIQIVPFYCLKFGDNSEVNKSPILSDVFEGEFLQTRHINPLIFGADIIFSSPRLSFSIGYTFNDYIKTKTRVQLRQVYTYEITDDYKYLFSDLFDDEVISISKIMMHKIPVNLFFSPLPKDIKKGGFDALFGLNFSFIYKENFEYEIDMATRYLYKVDGQYAGNFSVYSTSSRNSILQDRLFFVKANLGVRYRAPNNKFHLSIHYEFNDGRHILNSYTLFYGAGGSAGMSTKTTGNGLYFKASLPIGLTK